jgi:histone H1/5
MPTATTKKTYSVKKGSAPKAAAHVNHPSWADMIRECIAAHPTEARSGVSRPTIKKYVELKYNIKIDATAASQLNRAIAHGSEKGIFVLPKGPSGKVKLPPKSRPEHSKENIEAAPAKKPSKVVSKATASKPKPKAVSKPSTVAKKAPAPKVVKKRAAPARPASSTRPTSSATKSRPSRKPAAKPSPKKSKTEAVKKVDD